MAFSVTTSLKVVMKLDMNVMETSWYILKNDVKCWLLNGIKCSRHGCVDSGLMRILGFMTVFNQYKDTLAKLMYENKHLMKLMLKTFLFIEEKN